ncbi:MAG: T9SS type A sorting domain-containing protein [Sphingobacteriales bacterium]|nr:T9SS type A sorting domain-containing protein [Sphingobacteriales bacterium]
MKKTSVFCFLLLILVNLSSIAQNNDLYVVDFFNRTTDSLAPVPVHSNTSATTSFYRGNYNNTFIDLPLEWPSPLICDVTIPFTKKTLATNLGPVTSFPARASVSLGSKYNGSFHFGNCSGIMIGDKYVLTAKHCYNFDYPPVIPSTGSLDSAYVVPAYTNGTIIPGLNPVRIKKLYYPKKYNGSSSDLALLELETPLGNTTGWIGMGFNNDDSFFTQHLFHKFCTPLQSLLNDYPFNGDTMYYSYGKINTLIDLQQSVYSPPFMGIQAYFGCGVGIGESGSSLFYTNNTDSITTYGVLTFANNYYHTRITAENFYAFANIISGSVTAINDPDKEHLLIFPNPSSGWLYIKTSTGFTNADLMVYDLNGKNVLKKQMAGNNTINITSLAPGIYLLTLRIKGQLYSRKFIKK